MNKWGERDRKDSTHMQKNGSIVTSKNRLGLDLPPWAHRVKSKTRGYTLKTPTEVYEES